MGLGGEERRGRRRGRRSGGGAGKGGEREKVRAGGGEGVGGDSTREDCGRGRGREGEKGKNVLKNGSLPLSLLPSPSHLPKNYHHPHPSDSLPNNRGHLLSVNHPR